MNEGVLPRILIIDDLFGRVLPDGPNEDRANLCSQYLLNDVTNDSAKASSLSIKNPVAEAVFCRGLSPICSKVGDVVKHDLEGTLKVIRAGWDDRPLGLDPWAMVLLDLHFKTGLVTHESNRKVAGMPEGRESDDDPGSYFGLRILHAIQNEMHDLPVVILSSKPRDEVSRDFSQKGAMAFIPRIEGSPELLQDYLWRLSLIPDAQGTILGRSKAILLALRDARQVARSELPVLLRGERGTGKELFAQFIHNHSPRGERFSQPEILSLAGIPETLVEDALFGHVKGAFQGANANRKGAFERSDGGTLFLDEVGDTPLLMQPKLLRAIQFGEIQRLGNDSNLQVNVRIVSATNVDLEGGVATGTFRGDLLDRLRDGGTIVLPPLRYRKEDLPLLVEGFVREAEQRNRRALIREIEPEALEKLREHDWPGNIRELRSVVFDAVNKYPDVEHLVPVHIRFLTLGKTSVEHRKDVTESSPQKTTETVKETSVEHLIGEVDSFTFDSLKPGELVGKLPQIEGAFARLLARYLKAALMANVQNRTAENPDGEVRIHPSIVMMKGEKVSASKAADIIKQLLGTNDEAMRSLLADSENRILRKAIDKALSLRPKKRVQREEQRTNNS
jgi:DNA-binding NtrC family response regulator